MIGQTLAALAVGLLPLAMTLVQMRVFYAMKDGRTPTLINAIMVAVRVPLLILCTQLDDVYLVPGLAAATTVSYLVGAVVGEIWLRARYGSMHTGRTLVTVGKMILASAAGGVAGYYTVIALFDPSIDSFGEALLELVVGAAVGLVVIAVLATVLGVEELVPVRRRIAGFLGLGGRGGVGPAAPTGADPGQETEAAARPDSVVPAGHGTLDAAATAPAILAAPPRGPCRRPHHP